MDNEHTLPPTDGPASKVSDAAAQAWGKTREKAGEVLHTSERYVRDNPGISAAGIFSVAFLLGMLVGYSLAQEDHDDYSKRARKFAKRWGKKLNLE